jgi:hypothetical protein
MPLALEKDIHFDPHTYDAVIWADDDKPGRFRLVIPRKVLRDRYGMKGDQLSNPAAEKAIRDNWDKFERQAQAARDAGAEELVAT